MRNVRLLARGASIAAAACIVFLQPGGERAHAQVSACRSANCIVGVPGAPNLPPECKTRIGAQNIAGPRMTEVGMDSSPNPTCVSPVNAYKPGNVRIEGRNTAGNPWDYQCIMWHRTGSCTGVPWHSSTENTLGSTCVTAGTCAATGGNTTPIPCAWETGNINAATPNPVLEWSTCHYRDVAAANYAFFCRLHTAMTGMLTVVPPIRLDITKGTGNIVNLAWIGGSAAGPWEAFKHTNRAMPKDASLVRLSPTSGQATRTAVDTTCAPGPGQLCAYMVRECNLNGGVCIN